MTSYEERPKRLRVAFIDHVARLSGGEIALARLIAALPEIEAHVILGEDGPLVRTLQQAGAEVHVLPMTSTLRDIRRSHATSSLRSPATLLSLLGYMLRLRRELLRLDIDLVHTNSLKAAVYGGLTGRAIRVPVIWHIRDRIAADYLSRFAVAAIRLGAKVIPSAVVANSQATIATLPRARAATVLQNPVLLDPVAAPKDEIADLRAPHMQVFRIGVVGRLAEWKGQDVFLKAFAQACEAHWEAWIIGAALFEESEFEADLHRLVEELDIASQVVWRGFREDVGSELRSLDVLVHCSTKPEPFGQVIVEGMAAELPVIAAAAGGPLEIITNGIDGILTTPGDVTELCHAIQRLAADPSLRSALGRAAKESSTRFSPEAARQRMMAIYTEVMQCQSRSARGKGQRSLA